MNGIIGIVIVIATIEIAQWLYRRHVARQEARKAIDKATQETIAALRSAILHEHTNNTDGRR